MSAVNGRRAERESLLNEETYLFICFYSLSLPCCLRVGHGGGGPPRGGSCFQDAWRVKTAERNINILSHVLGLSAVRAPEYAGNKDFGDADAAADGSVTWTPRTKIDDHLRRLTTERRFCCGCGEIG